MSSEPKPTCPTAQDSKAADSKPDGECKNASGFLGPIKITREDLYNRIWAKPLNKVAEDLGTTYVELARSCEEMNVPKPLPGHWRRIELAMTVEVTALPEPGDGVPSEVKLRRQGEPRKLPDTASSVSPDSGHADDQSAEGVPETSPDKGTDASAASPVTSNAAAGIFRVPDNPERVQYIREELYQAIWTVPCLKLAAKFGISDVALAKICRSRGIPRPPRGYWARLEAGEKLGREPLPPAQPGQERKISFNIQENLSRREEWAANNLLTAGRGSKPGHVELPVEGTELHAIAQRHRKALEKWAPT